MVGYFLSASMARQPEAAATQAIREVYTNDQPALGRDHRLLPANEQGLNRTREGLEQQYSRYPMRGT